MPDIRYVVLSDMHLGQDMSILTHLVEDPGAAPGKKHYLVDPLAAAPALTGMVDILAELIGHNQGKEPPVLILLGDVIELALTEMHISAMVFQRFVESWVRDGKPLFSKVIYVPGNHDHHVWEQARSAMYNDYLARADTRVRYHRPPHSTRLMDGAGGGDGFVKLLMDRALGDHAIPVEIYYPNFALHAGDRLVLFHHGHFAEPIYRLMSTLHTKINEGAALPGTVEELERQNFGWIDFFWGTLGRQGEVGDNIERIYDVLSFPEKLEALTDRLATAFLDDWKPAHWYSKLEHTVIKDLVLDMIHHVMSKMMTEPERQQPHEAPFPSAGLLAELSAYAGGMLREQVQSELGAVPSEVTFVFGHTHQPFERLWDGSALGKKVKLYNTGGWAVDPTPDIDERLGGAAVLLDEDLSGASLRFFNEARSDSDYRVTIAAADASSPLYQRLLPLINADSEACRRFSRAAAAGVRRTFEVVAQVQDGASTGTQ